MTYIVSGGTFTLLTHTLTLANNIYLLDVDPYPPLDTLLTLPGFKILKNTLVMGSKWAREWDAI